MKTIFRVLWLPGTVILVTVAWLRLDSVAGWRGIYLPRTGALLLAAGTLLALWCAALFVFRGQGSPHPFAAKTRNLVTTGPYGVVRNPMMWGVGAILVGLALMAGSAGLWFGIALFLLFVRWFVPLYEERDMERRFGAEYRAYCADVPRWWPRFRRHPETDGRARAAGGGR